MSQTNMLDARQDREFKRDEKLQEYLLEKQKEYSKYAPFSRVAELLFSNIARVEPLVPVKGKKGITITERKNELKEAIAANVNNICIPATEYALSTGDKDLQHAVRFRASDITGARDSNVPAIVTTITDALKPLAGNPEFDAYEITADMLSALAEQSNTFSATFGKAAAVDTGSAIANDNLNDIFKDIRGNIASLRRLLPHFSKTNPDFVTGFNTSAAVDYSGIRHSGIEGIVINPLTGQPVEGAIITGEGKNKLARTDKKGYYKLIRLKITDMTITVTATGFDTQTFDVKIIRGKIGECNIELKGRLLSLAATA